MVILTICLVLAACFAILIVIAGIKGFFVGAGEEIKRQHLVIKSLITTYRRNKARKKKTDA